MQTTCTNGILLAVERGKKYISQSDKTCFSISQTLLEREECDKNRIKDRKSFIVTNLLKNTIKNKQQIKSY